MYNKNGNSSMQNPASRFGGNSGLIGYRGNPLQPGARPPMGYGQGGGQPVNDPAGMYGPNYNPAMQGTMGSQQPSGFDPWAASRSASAQPSFQNPYTTQGPAMGQGVGRGQQQNFGPLPPGSTQGNSGPMDQFSTDAWNSPTMGQSTNAAPGVPTDMWNGMDNLTLSGRGTRSFVYDPATMGNSLDWAYGSVGQPVAQTRGQQAQFQLVDNQGNVVNQGNGFGRTGGFRSGSLTPGQTYSLMYDLPTTGAWNLIGNAHRNPAAPGPNTQSLQALLSGPRRYT